MGPISSGRRHQEATAFEAEQRIPKSRGKHITVQFLTNGSSYVFFSFLSNDRACFRSKLPCEQLIKHGYKIYSLVSLQAAEGSLNINKGLTSTFKI